MSDVVLEPSSLNTFSSDYNVSCLFHHICLLFLCDFFHGILIAEQIDDDFF